jgi:lysophospholipid acyltransferase (LPLAT)-like uncharacterized protein
VAQLAAMTGAVVLPCGAWTTRAVTLNSWDRMRIPLPFGRGRLVCGTPISVSREAWAETLPEITIALNMAMASAAG